MRRAGGGGRDEASAAALRLLLAAGSATAPSPLQQQLLPQPDPKASQSRPAPKPTSHFPTAAGAYSQPGKKLPRWLGVNRHLEQRTKGKESHKAGRLGSRGLVSLTPPPSCKMRLRLERGWGGWVPPYLLASQDRSSGRSRAARAPRSGKSLPHAAIPSARSAVAHTRTHTRAPARPPPAEGELVLPPPPDGPPAALPAAAPPPRSPRRTCCQDARRSRCRCSRPRSCAADGGGRSSESPRPPRGGGGGGGARDPSFT